jgi:hypothetical protein
MVEWLGADDRCLGHYPLNVGEVMRPLPRALAFYVFLPGQKGRCGKS